MKVAHFLSFCKIDQQTGEKRPKAKAEFEQCSWGESARPATDATSSRVRLPPLFRL